MEDLTKMCFLCNMHTHGRLMRNSVLALKLSPIPTSTLKLTKKSCQNPLFRLECPHFNVKMQFSVFQPPC